MATRDGGSYDSFTRRLGVLVGWFEGQYVPMVDGRVVAQGRDAKQVYDQARRKSPKRRIFLRQVPTKGMTVLFLREIPVLKTVEALQEGLETRKRAGSGLTGPSS